MAYRTHPAADAGGDEVEIDAESNARATALTDLGLTATPERMLWHFHPFYSWGSQTTSLTNTGTASQATAVQGWTLATGATINSRAIANPTSSSTAQIWFVVGAGKKIWVSSRFKVNTAVGAADELLRMLSDFTALSHLTMGVNGTTSTALFSTVCPTGGAITSAVAVDTSFHDHTFFRDGTTGNYRVDTNAVVQGDIRPSATFG